MRKICVVCVGTLKEKFWKDAVLEYQKRLSKFCDLEICEIVEEKLLQNPSESEIKKALEVEAKKILEKAKGKKTFCFCIEGKPVSSPKFAKLIEKESDQSPLCFVIGSSFGISEELKKQFEGLSFGQITLPHQLFRVVVMEQIYRSFTILNGSTYHK